MATNYKAIAKKLKFEGRAFINGKYVNAIDGKNLKQSILQQEKNFVLLQNVIIKMSILQLKFQEKLLIAVFGLDVRLNIEKKFY